MKDTALTSIPPNFPSTSVKLVLNTRNLRLLDSALPFGGQA